MNFPSLPLRDCLRSLIAVIALIASFHAPEIRAQRSINVDIQANNGGQYQGPNASGTTVTWNHVGSDNTSSLVYHDGSSSSVSLNLSGANGRWNSTWSSHGLLEDFLFRDANARAQATISGLDSTQQYDLHIYTGVEGGRFFVGGSSRDATNNATGPGTDPVIGKGASFVQGQNYVTFSSITPNASGAIQIEYQDSPLSGPTHGNFSGFTLEEKSTVIALPSVGSQVTINSLLSTPGSIETSSEVSVTGVTGATSFRLGGLGGSPLKATSGELDLLGFKLPISAAEVDLTRRVITLTLQVGLPYPIFTDNNNQPIRQRAVMEIDATGRTSIVGGQVFIPQLKAGKSLELANLNLQFDVRTGIVSGGVDVAVGKTLIDPCSSVSLDPSRRFVGGFIEFRNGQFNSLSLTGSNLRKPIGAAYLDLIQASVFNLAAPDGVWSVQGRMVFNGGCPIRVAGATDAYPITIDTTGTYFADQRFELKGQGKIFNIPVTEAAVVVKPSETSVEAGVVFGSVFDSRAKLTMRPGQFYGSAIGDLKIPSSTPGGIGGMNFPSVSASIDNNGVRGSFSVLLSKAVPEKCVGGGSKSVGYRGEKCATIFGKRVCVGVDLCCVSVPIPKVCTPAIPEVRPSFGFEYNWNSGQFGFTKRNVFELDPWDPGFHPMMHDPETNSTVTFLTNWERLDRATTGNFGRKFAANENGSAQCSFTVPDATPGVIFRLAYSNQNEPQTGLKVTLPSGTVLDSSAGELPFGFDQAAGYARVNVEAREVVVLLIDPQPGQYDIEVQQAEDLNDFSVDAVVQETLPYAGILQVDGPTEEGMIDIYWAAEDISQPTTVSAYLEPDTEGNQGVLLTTRVIEQTPPEDDVEIFTIDLNDIEAQPGDYYIMLKTDDGTNAPDFSYSDVQFTFEDPDAPEPVLTIASGVGNEHFTVAWTPSESPDVAYYNVLYTLDSDFSDSIERFTVDSETTEATITGLKNGTPYLVTVIAGNGDGIESTPYDIHRVIPSAAPGQSPPLITSAPDTDATAGYLYTYFPVGFDADQQSQQEDISTLFNSPLEQAADPQPALSWVLDKAPAGMSMDPSGLITWTPNENQIGNHEVELRLNKPALVSFEGQSHRALTTVQTFTIDVLDPINLNGLEPHPYTFISSPQLSVRGGETYRYRPEFTAPDSDSIIQLVSGPDGMEVTEDNEVIWDASEDAFGEFVWLRAFTSGGDSFDQFYFLHVTHPDYQLPTPIRIADVQRTSTGEVFLNWVGTAEEFAIQRKSALDRSGWETISGPIASTSFNAFIDENPSLGTGFYRIIEWANPSAE